MKLEEFNKFLKNESSLADAAIERSRDALCVRDRAEFEKAVPEIIWHKFLLQEKPKPEDDITELAMISTKRTLMLAEGNLALADISAGCLEADTTDTKKILLILMLKRRLGVAIQPEMTAEIETVSQLCEKLYELY